jgi:hypothetical protein
MGAFRSTMSNDWLDNLERYLPPAIEHAVKVADKAFRDFALQIHLTHWHPISTTPCNQELELHIAEGREILTLEFPCLQTNEGVWINVDLGAEIMIQPVEWRVWQRNKSPQPHHSRIKFSDRSTLFHHHRKIRARARIEADYATASIALTGECL